MRVNPGRCDSRQAPSLYLLVKPITRVGLFLITMIQTHLRLRYPWRPARRDVRIGFPVDLLFTPLCGLRISRYRRGDAIPRSLGAGNLAQHRASSCQGSDHLAFHPQACACFERTDRTSPIKIRSTGGLIGQNSTCLQPTLELLYPPKENRPGVAIWAEEKLFGGKGHE